MMADPTVFSVFDRIRCGKTTVSDIEILRRRTFGNRFGPDYSEERWQSATLVTPRNAVRQAWNNQAALRHSFQTGNQIFVCPSVDEGLHADKDAMIWTADNKAEFLATWSIICMNGPARVTVNEAIPLGIANRSRVIIREVIPHPSDYRGWQQVRDQRRITKLEQPPITVFVERIEEYDNTPKWQLPSTK